MLSSKTICCRTKVAKSHHDKRTRYSKMSFGAASYQRHCLSGTHTLPGPVHVESWSWTIRFTKRKQRSCGTKLQMSSSDTYSTARTSMPPATSGTPNSPPARQVSFSVVLALPDYNLDPSRGHPQKAPTAVQAARATEHRSPGNMAATDFLEEIRSVGEKLLLKLHRLPQAEPLEKVAFSIMVLFIGTVLLLLLLIVCSYCCSHCFSEIPVQPRKPR